MIAPSAPNAIIAKNENAYQNKACKYVNIMTANRFVYAKHSSHLQVVYLKSRGYYSMTQNFVSKI